MRKKKKEDEVPNEFEQAEQEAIENPDAEAELEASLPEDGSPTEQDAESDVKRPELTGKKKPKKTDFEQPADNNMSREVIEDEE